MASKRQIKKTQLLRLEKELKAKLKDLSFFEGKIAEVDEAIKEAERALKKKKNKLEALQRELADITKMTENTNLLSTFNENLTLKDFQAAVQKAKDAKARHDAGIDEIDNAEKWSYIKEYHDLVNAGLITPSRTEQQVYDEAPYLLQNILSMDRIEALVERGREKAQELAKKYEERQNNYVAFDW